MIKLAKCHSLETSSLVKQAEKMAPEKSLMTFSAGIIGRHAFNPSSAWPPSHLLAYTLLYLDVKGSSPVYPCFIHQKSPRGSRPTATCILREIEATPLNL